MILKRDFKIDRIIGYKNLDNTSPKMCEVWCTNKIKESKEDVISFMVSKDDFLNKLGMTFSLDLLGSVLSCELISQELNKEGKKDFFLLNMSGFINDKRYYLDAEGEKIEEHVSKIMNSISDSADSVQQMEAYSTIYSKINLSDIEYEEISKLPKPVYFKLNLSK